MNINIKRQRLNKLFFTLILYYTFLIFTKIVHIKFLMYMIFTYQGIKAQGLRTYLNMYSKLGFNVLLKYI